MKRTFVLLSLFAVFFAACEKEPEETALSNNVYHPTQDPAIVTEEGVEQGAIVGLFSVSDTLRVRFSRGNLQYRAKDSKWRFAGNQFDVVGKENENIGKAFSGWIDLFGWGTSGNANSMPYCSEMDPSLYATSVNMLVGNSYDWGVSNEILNAEVSWIWRTLTVDEWNYLLEGRSNASQLKSYATVMGHQGLLLLPDEWICPANVSVVPSAQSYATNNYDKSAWIYLQANGAVFLPATGWRMGTTVQYPEEGYYWTAVGGGSEMAMYLSFRSGHSVTLTFGQRYLGCGVRLVKNE